MYTQEYACLAVTCHLHFWENDWYLLCAAVVTWGWNEYQNIGSSILFRFQDAGSGQNFGVEFNARITYGYIINYIL